MTRLLAINFGGIGDEILFLPTLSAVKGAFPDWHITLLVEPRSKSVRDITDLIDDILTFDIKKRPLLVSDLIHLIGLLKSQDFDAVLSSGSSPLVSALLFLSGIPRRIGYDTSPLAKVFLTESVPLNRNQYAAAMYQDLVRGLGIVPDAFPRPAIFLSDDTRRKAEEMLQAAAAKQESARAASLTRTASGAGEGSRPRRVLIHPGTSRLAVEKGLNKTWPPENWAALALKLASNDIQVIISGGPDDLETIREIEARLPGRLTEGSNVISTYGMTGSLLDLAGLIDISTMVVCVDSAPMHVACALGKPLVALFGPTDERKLLPPGERFHALRKETLSGTAPGAATSRQPYQHPKASYLYPGSPSVELPPDSVCLYVLDRLKEV